VANLINMLNEKELKEIRCAFANNWNKNPAIVNRCKTELLKHIGLVIFNNL